MRENSSRRKFSKSLLQWYAHRGRILPWRNITDPYRILVSEIMLQQTQVSRVLVKYGEFLRRFPTLRSLARARQRDVVIAWRGMGYNNRAVRLHKFAQTVVADHKGKIPADAEVLMSLPGIGRYTAHAMLASAFSKDVPVVDVNVRRVLSRMFWKMVRMTDVAAEEEVWSKAQTLLPKGKAYAFNQALMDLGSTICTARRPVCEVCPVAESCASGPTLSHAGVPLRKRIHPRNRLPDRIYRGRIVEVLRSKNGAGSLTVAFLKKRVAGSAGRSSLAWFASLLSGLEKDGLIRVRGTGAAAHRRVSLA